MTSSKDQIKPSPIPRGKNAGQERNGLYLMCFNNLPKHHKVSTNIKGEAWHGLDLEKISSEINVSKQKISLWMKENSLPGKRVRALIGLKGSTLTFEKLGPFINTN